MRWRNKALTPTGYNGRMKEETPADPSILNRSVADLLRAWPETIPVFLKHRMVCVGCCMAAFDSLADAAENYQLSSTQLENEILSVVRRSIRP